MKLEGKTAVVTGAARGMGKDLSAALLQEGCRVAMVDIDSTALEQAVGELNELGECRPFRCDVSNRNQVYGMAEAVQREMGPVSLLVNNAGIVRAAELLDLDDEDIEKMIAINLTAQFWTCKAFLPDMIAAKEGHIVNYSSAGGLLAIPNLSAYCAGKYGVIGFSDSLRQELRKKKLDIGVTYVCPNTVNTGMFEGSKMVAGTKMLSPSAITACVVRAIKANKPVVAVPSFSVRYLTPLTKTLLPVRAMDWLNAALGMADANDTWVGRLENTEKREGVETSGS